jgi:hypothetical protein
MANPSRTSVDLISFDFLVSDKCEQQNSDKKGTVTRTVDEVVPTGVVVFLLFEQ